MAEKAKEKEAKAVTPWKPFMGLTRWESEMDRMMDEFFGRRMRPWWPERWLRAEEITPAVDVYEEKGDIVVKAELPGMEKNDIEVNISDSELTLKGEKKKEENIEDEDYYRCERSHGAFLRSVDLPTDVQADKVKASFKNGILEVRLPKTEEAKTKEIKVKVE
ncbi:MAG TPA: Hsp20/alpha crystallin family protein [Candidatus Binatia bacterium]|jgi:HSP20 family protein